MNIKVTTYNLVKSLVAALHHPLRIRILLASHPEVYLQFTFNSSSSSYMTRSLGVPPTNTPPKKILLAPRRLVRQNQAQVLPPTSHRPGLPLISFMSSPRPIYLRFNDSQIYRQSPPYRRLDVTHNLRSSKGERDTPYTELNSSYHHVVCNVDDIDALNEFSEYLLLLTQRPSAMGCAHQTM